MHDIAACREAATRHEAQRREERTKEVDMLVDPTP